MNINALLKEDVVSFAELIRFFGRADKRRSAKKTVGRPVMFRFRVARGRWLGG